MGHRRPVDEKRPVGDGEDGKECRGKNYPSEGWMVGEFRERGEVPDQSRGDRTSDEADGDEGSCATAELGAAECGPGGSVRFHDALSALATVGHPACLKKSVLQSSGGFRFIHEPIENRYQRRHTGCGRSPNDFIVDFPVLMRNNIPHSNDLFSIWNPHRGIRIMSTESVQGLTKNFQLPFNCRANEQV